MGKIENKMKFGDKLKNLREEKSLSTSELSEMLGIEESTLIDLETGEKKIVDCGLSIWLLLLVIFNIKHEDLINQTDVELNLTKE
jgi:transcriptional regulator with XRE-family HTH domain